MRFTRIAMILMFLSVASTTVVELALSSAAAAASTISITSPTNGATEKGTIQITAYATADAGQVIDYVEFYDNGSDLGSGGGCAYHATTCTSTLAWNATNISGTYSLTATVFINGSAPNATSSPVTIQILNPPPTISIISPANGSTIKGTVILQASAAIDPSQSEAIDYVEFYDNGSDLGSGGGCAYHATTCTSTLAWNTTNLSGPYSLTATVVTNGTAPNTTSSAVSVQVVSPPPTVIMTAPKNGSGVRGTVTLTASAAIDPSQSDSINDIELFANGTELGTGSGCAYDATSCVATYRWDTKGTTRTTSLWAVVQTNGGVSSTSTKISVVLFRKTKVSLSLLPKPSIGQRVNINGRVLTTTGKLGASGLSIRVIETPILGKRIVLSTRSAASGKFLVRFRATHDAKIQVFVIGNSLYGGSRTSSYLIVHR